MSPSVIAARDRRTIFSLQGFCPRSENGPLTLLLEVV